MFGFDNLMALSRRTKITSHFELAQKVHDPKEFGFSLLELLMGVAILSVISLTTAQYISNQLRSYKNIDQQYNMVDLYNQIRSFLSEKDVCSAASNFGGKSLSSSISVAQLTSISGDSVFFLGQEFSDVRITEMTLSDAIQTHSGDIGTTTFNVTLEKRSTSLASQKRTFSMNLIVNVTGTTINDCYAVSLEGPSDWTSQSTGINYGGAVGIGLESGETPQSQLHVKDRNYHQVQFFGPSKAIVDGSSTEYKERALYVESQFKDPSKQQINAGTFVLKDSTDNIITRFRPAVANLGDDNPESGLRVDIINGSENRAGEFSMYNESSLSKYYYEDNDSLLLVRAKSAYWTSGNDYIALEATAHDDGKTKSRGRLGYATSGGQYYGGHFKGAVGLETVTCDDCSVISEMMQVAELPDNGSVLCLDKSSGKLAPCEEDRSRLVIGIAQELAEIILRRGCSKTMASKGAENSLILGVLDTQEWRRDDACKGWYPVALMGLSEETKVLCNYNGVPLKKGDFLVTSTTKGHLRALASDESTSPSFQIVGRAMSSCPVDAHGEIQETDLIHVLVK